MIYHLFPGLFWDHPVSDRRLLGVGDRPIHRRRADHIYYHVPDATVNEDINSSSRHVDSDLYAH